MPNYKVFTYTNEKGLNVVKVGSTYAGKPVWGYATCAPEDNYDYDYGYRLAKARCDKKIAEKRLKASTEKMNMYYAYKMTIDSDYENACDYFTNSFKAKDLAEKNYLSILMEKVND